MKTKLLMTTVERIQKQLDAGNQGYLLTLKHPTWKT